MTMFKNKVLYRISKNNPGVGKRLAKTLDCEIVTSQTSKLPENCLVINYGRSTIPKFYFDDNKDSLSSFTFLNHPYAVGLAVDKLQSLEIIKKLNIPTLEFTTDIKKVHSWVKEGSSVVCRKTLIGKQGNGIEIINANSIGYPVSPLYTKYYDKTHEFRVHVFNGNVIDFVQKKKMGSAKLKKRGLTEADMLLRNHKRGWIFAHNNLICHGLARVTIEKIACDSVDALSLDFGGVDILAKFKEDGEFERAVVCEVNSAPGMKCQKTFDAYVKSINNVFNNE